MKLKDKKSLMLVILTLIIITILVLSIFNNIRGQRYEIEQKNFLSDIANIQIKLSFYLGGMNNDTFGIYTNEEIILGKKLDEENSNKKDIIPIVDSSKKIETDGKISYEIDSENLKEVLNIDIKQYDGITFYIQDGSIVKAKLSKIPKWWNSVMDIYKL